MTSASHFTYGDATERDVDIEPLEGPDAGGTMRDDHGAPTSKKRPP